MKHLNGDILCAVDTETTGVVPGFHDIIEICVLPLDSNLEPMRGVLPFNLILSPKRPDNVDINALRVSKQHDFGFDFEDVHMSSDRLVKSILEGIDPYTAADRLVEWFQKLNLAPSKRLVPLAHNWPFDRDFIRDWLGVTGMEMIFSHRYRDTMVYSLIENDRCHMRGISNYPYAKNTLGYVAGELKIDKGRCHTALGDCLTTAQVYKAMMQRSF